MHEKVTSASPLVTSVASSSSPTQIAGNNRNLESWRKQAVNDISRPSWDSIHTVALSDEERRHNIQHQKVRGCCARAWWMSQGWILAIALGLLSSLSGVLIEIGSEALSSSRMGWCASSWFKSHSHCREGDWIGWGNSAKGFFISVCGGSAMAALSAWMVWKFAPGAAGSGIPETKVILNGFVLPDAVSLRTLCVKVPGLILSVSAGMALGKEGPLVHVSMCWAQLLSRLFKQYQNEGKRRELFSAAAAAGVSTAFGAPIGGVLFSLEEVSSSFPSRTLLRSFAAAVTAALVLQVANLSGTRRLTMFNVESDYNTISNEEIVVFAILGIIGGLVGAAFNFINPCWSKFRNSPGFKRRIHPILEVTLIALITLLTSWPLMKTRVLSSDAIHAMFLSCQGEPRLRVELGLCTSDGEYEHASLPLLGSLLLAAGIRFIQMSLTFGTKCPAGLFVPSLYIGACLGRFAGIVAQYMNAKHHFVSTTIEPGVYSMIGAAAVLGGVCRVTISLVVIMLELTDSLAYVVPFMVAILVAKLVGDACNQGIYDLYIVLKGYPFLHEEMDVTYQERCCDVMETGLTRLDVNLKPRPVDLRAMLAAYNFRGFPVVDGTHFIGYIKRDQLQDTLDRLKDSRNEDDQVTLADLMPSVDCTVMRLVPESLLSQAHVAFKQLRVQHIFLVGAQGYKDGYRQDVLQGILSKKNFIRHLKAGHVGHLVDHPATGPPVPEFAQRWRIQATTARRISTLSRIDHSQSGPLTQSLATIGDRESVSSTTS